MDISNKKETLYNNNITISSTQYLSSQGVWDFLRNCCSTL